MKRHQFFLLFFGISFISLMSPYTCSFAQETAPVGQATFIYGNRDALIPELQKGWGFGAIIEFDGKKILFNTAGNEDVLINNFEVLGLSPKDLDVVVLSHEHWEMIDALYYILDENPNVPVVATDKVIQTLSRKFPTWIRNFISVDKYYALTDRIIFQNIKSGPRRGGPAGIWEIHIILKTDEGLVLFTGCGHPSLPVIIKKSKELTEAKKINLIAGGTRLLRPHTHIEIEDSDEDFYIPQFNYYTDGDYKNVMDELKALGVEFVMPTHCTLEPAETFFRQSFKDRYIKHTLGLELDLPVQQKSTVK